MAIIWVKQVPKKVFFNVFSLYLNLKTWQKKVQNQNQLRRQDLPDLRP